MPANYTIDAKPGFNYKILEALPNPSARPDSNNKTRGARSKSSGDIPSDELERSFKETAQAYLSKVQHNSHKNGSSIVSPLTTETGSSASRNKPTDNDTFAIQVRSMHFKPSFLVLSVHETFDSLRNNLDAGVIALTYYDPIDHYIKDELIHDQNIFAVLSWAKEHKKYGPLTPRQDEFLGSETMTSSRLDKASAETTESTTSIDSGDNLKARDAGQAPCRRVAFVSPSGNDSSRASGHIAGGEGPQKGLDLDSAPKDNEQARSHHFTSSLIEDGCSFQSNASTAVAPQKALGDRQLSQRDEVPLNRNIPKDDEGFASDAQKAGKEVSDQIFTPYMSSLDDHTTLAKYMVHLVSKGLLSMDDYHKLTLPIVVYNSIRRGRADPDAIKIVVFGVNETFDTLRDELKATALRFIYKEPCLGGTCLDKLISEKNVTGLLRYAKEYKNGAIEILKEEA
ncbi:uncharacterized protein KY384_000496 [Bacidia gigantensis]|uniref:uncharacterized protein n=1 Tax=Bacidia gigantensis TaxID=2732470 RepID=UPI001D048511|nr:uncharacterized protein KY384_000496 [Bacidia gigantensis]KAG8525736.1 hypothetical protein KY384_000496 [Bacidia gigantensis]